MTPFASNLRRLIARLGLTVDQAAARCQVDLRTVKAILAGDHQPQARTLHRLAMGLDVPVDELFQDPSLLLHRTFDRQTNPLVTQVVEEHPELFVGWNEADFDDLYSRFGEGGALTADGVVETATFMAFKRQVHQKLALLLESNEAELVSELINLMYQRALVQQPPTARAMTSSCH
jgi:transcriptional regulator with XRE-family HTH domain